jgi:hypothetical protein
MRHFALNFFISVVEQETKKKPCSGLSMVDLRTAYNDALNAPAKHTNLEFRLAPCFILFVALNVRSGQLVL